MSAYDVQPTNLPLVVGDLQRRVQILEAVRVAVSYDIKIVGDDATFVVGDNTFIWMIEADVGGKRLTGVEAFVSTPGSTDTVIQVRNRTTGNDMLLVPITIDAGDETTCDADVPAEIDPDEALVSHCDLLAIDIDDAGSGAMGLGVIVQFG